LEGLGKLVRKVAEILSCKGKALLAAPDRARKVKRGISYQLVEHFVHGGGRKPFYQRLFAGSCDREVLLLGIIAGAKRE
jgi:hypothetical protein